MTFVDLAGGLKDLTTYYWKVQAIDQYGADRPSEVWSFKTDNTNGYEGALQGIAYSNMDYFAINSLNIALLNNTNALVKDGKFLAEIPPGTISLIASASGFTSVSLTDIPIKAGEITNLTIPMSPSSQDASRTLSLSPGWNLISLPLQPSNTAITSVLNDISTSFTIVWAYDALAGVWKNYQPSAPSDLTAMEAGKGYWIKMTEAKSLVIAGQPASSQTISLKTGWNLVGWNKTTSTPVSTTLTGISSNTSIVWAYDALAGVWKNYQPSAPSDLSNFTPGLGFWIKVNADVNWTQ
jgi:hypothetical protein